MLSTVTSEIFWAPWQFIWQRLQNSPQQGETRPTWIKITNNTGGLGKLPVTVPTLRCLLLLLFPTFFNLCFSICLSDLNVKLLRRDGTILPSLLQVFQSVADPWLASWRLHLAPSQIASEHGRLGFEDCWKPRPSSICGLNSLIHSKSEQIGGDLVLSTEKLAEKVRISGRNKRAFIMKI